MSAATRTASRKEAQRDLRKMERASICGAAKGDGSPCVAKAGSGTDHVGSGRCRFHGGSSPSGKRGAAGVDVREAHKKVMAMARPIPTNPTAALQAVLSLSAGQLAYATEKVGQLDEAELFEEHGGINRYVALQQVLMKTVTDVAVRSAAAGIADRVVSLQEREAELIGAYFQAVLGDIDLEPEQRARVGPAMRRHLHLVAGSEA